MIIRARASMYHFFNLVKHKYQGISHLHKNKNRTVVISLIYLNISLLLLLLLAGILWFFCNIKKIKYLLMINNGKVCNVSSAVVSVEWGERRGCFAAH